MLLLKQGLAVQNVCNSTYLEVWMDCGKRSLKKM
jgi:hypothetical protein